MNITKSKASIIATAVSAIGIGCLAGKATRNVIGNDSSFLQKIGIVTGGVLVALMSFNTVNEWLQKKVDENYVDEKESPDTVDA